MNTTTLSFDTKGLLISKPTSLQLAVDLFKLHLDASVKALERHMKGKDFSFFDLDEFVVAEIKLEDSSVTFILRDREDSDTDIYGDLKPIDLPEEELETTS